MDSINKPKLPVQSPKYRAREKEAAWGNPKIYLFSESESHLPSYRLHDNKETNYSLGRITQKKKILAKLMVTQIKV